MNTEATHHLVSAINDEQVPSEEIQDKDQTKYYQKVNAGCGNELVPERLDFKVE
jgi:hypothetical protein